MGNFSYQVVVTFASDPERFKYAVDVLRQIQFDRMTTEEVMNILSHIQFGLMSNLDVGQQSYPNLYRFWFFLYSTNIEEAQVQGWIN